MWLRVCMRDVTDLVERFHTVLPAPLAHAVEYSHHRSWVGKRCGTNLYRVCAGHDELDGIACGRYTADSDNRQIPMRFPAVEH